MSRPQERVSPMNSISKIAIAVVAVALVIVIGLIVLSANTEKTEGNTTVQTVAAATEAPTAEPTKAPEEEAQDEAQGEGEMYEGALAGLTEEEIGKLAMAEEQSASGESGEQTAEEDGTMDESVAGVAD